MGIEESKLYSVPITEIDQSNYSNCTAIYRNPKSVSGLDVNDMPNINTLQDAFIQSVIKYPHKNFLGTRDPLSRTFQYKTYNDILELAQAVGSAIANQQLAPEITEFQGYKMQFVGVFSKNREEWLITDLACILYGYTLVPFYDTLGPENISHILQQTNLQTVFCGPQQLDTLLNTLNIFNLKTIICFEEIQSEVTKNLIKEKNLNILFWPHILIAGRQKIQQLKPVLPSDISTLSYTAGTTGLAKGVMLSHRNFVSQLSILSSHDKINIFSTDIHLSYLPLPHVLERIVVYNMMFKGAQICFYSGEVSKILKDIQDVRPTIFVSVPRLYNKFYEQIHQNFNQLQGFKKFIADTAIADKLDRLSKNAEYTHPIWDPLIFKETKQVFGGRVRYMITGSAPIQKIVLDFLKIAVCCPIIEGYGQTESTGSSFLTQSYDATSGHVGGPAVNVEFKIQDVPDMNYYSSDEDTEGYPMPRGEILLRGPSIFCGYLKDLEKTNESLDGDGWLHTGDIGLIRRDGSIKIIDRKKNIFKLAHGEYVAPEKVENIYLRCPGVSEVFVYGDSLQSYCIAVVVPIKEYVINFANQLNILGNYEQLCQDQTVVNHYLQNLTQIGKEEKLAGFEQAKKIYLEIQSLQENGLLNSSMKIQRFNAKLKFKPIIDKLYKEALQQQKI